MNALCKTLAAFALTALLASPAFAQGRGFGGGFGSPVMLLGNGSVQKELKLDDKQIESTKQLGEEARDKMRSAMEEARDLEGDARREKMQKVMMEVNESSKKSLASVLKPEQSARLHQIYLQQSGPMAFSNPDVQKELKFTDAQKEKVKDVVRELGEKRREVFADAGGDRAAAMEKMQAMNKEYGEKLKAELNDEQGKSYKQMLGSPFELVREQR